MTSIQFKHIEQIRKDFHEGSERLKRSTNNSIQTLAHDLYNKHTHFIFELIQNAEDNTYRKQNTHPPYISFRLTKTDPTTTSGANGALIIQNNEIGFNHENVNAICAVGETTKKKDQGYIGEKGIGFKSVFRVTDNPHIFSNGYQFSLPNFDEETRLGYIVPQWINTPPANLNFSETYIILPLTKYDFGYEKIEEMLQDIEPEVILFLSTLEEIKIETDTGDNLTILKDSSAAPEVAIIVEGKKQSNSFLKSENFLVCSRRFDKPKDIHHKKRERIKTRYVSVAFPTHQNSTAVGKIFAYLPVRSDTNFPFLINADFILPSSREDIQDVPWNHWLMECVANLVTSELLPFLKERRLLRVLFLEILASRLNELVNDKESLFYPIFTRMRETFEKEQFLPTHDNAFVAAQCAVLTRSDAVRNLLSNVQLSQFFSRPNDELKWLSPEITLDRTPHFRQYAMELLGIEEVTPDMFARRLSCTFLSMQTDEWVVKFYKFLSGQPALWRSAGAVLRSKPILRLQDCTHVNPYQDGLLPTAYLSDRTDTDTLLPIVKLDISQDNDAYEFLKALGIQEYDFVAEVIETILPKYTEEFPAIPLEEHKRDFAKIKKAYDTDSREKKTLLRNALEDTPFILAEKPDQNGKNYFKPDNLYFGNDDLHLYFEGNTSYGFVNMNVYSFSTRELFTDLGVMDSVRVIKKEKDRQGYVSIHSSYGNHKRGHDGFDSDIKVDGIEHALKHPTPEKSAFIWNHIVIPNADFVKGTVERSSQQTYAGSLSEEEMSGSFGELLIKTKWIPDSNGKMHLPSEISIDDLPDSFRRNEQLTKKLGMPMSMSQIVDIVSPAIGVSSDILSGIIEASPEIITQIQSLLQLSSDNDFPNIAISHATLFPVSPVSNPERRAKHVYEELENSPDQEYIEKVRSVRISKGTINPKTWLSRQYENVDGQVVCQICQKEMRFKYRDGEYYFEAVEMLRDYFTKEYEAQFLALCTECSSKYKIFVKQIPEAMEALKNNLIAADRSGEYTVPLKFGDKDENLRFVERHWLDIKTILSYYAQQSEPIPESSVTEQKLPTSQTAESPQPGKKNENWNADKML